MKKLLFTFLLAATLVPIARSQCAFSGSQFGFAAAPTTQGSTVTITTCNYYGEYSEVTGFLSAMTYSLNILDGGLVTVFDLSNTVVASGTVPFLFTPPSNGDYYLQWNGVGCATDFDCHETTVTNTGFSAPCTNPAAAGTTVATVGTACPGQPFTLSLNGTSSGSGISYQWQSSPDGVTYTDITAANGSSYTATQTVMTYYKCIVTCSAGTPVASTPLMVDMGACIIMGNGSQTACSGNFYDSGGGSGDYANGENYTLTITPTTPGSLLQVNFSSFDVEMGWEEMTVYNGNSTASPLLGIFDTDPGSITSTAADGSLTFVFTSDGSVVYSGWVATLGCVTPPTNNLACSAIAIPVDGSVNNYNNGGANTEAGESTIAPPATGYNETDGWGESTISFSTWFTFVAPASGNMEISCTDIEIDGQVAIYTTTDCGDFSLYTLVAANDDAVDFTSQSPEFSICGLTPGATYYLMYDSGNTYSSGAFSISLTPIDANAGTFVDVISACSGETVDLFDGISGNDAGGTWTEMIPTVGLSGSDFNTAGLAYQIFDFEYVVVNGCDSDTSNAQVQIFGPSSAGDDGVLTVCFNEQFNLLDGLSGVVDLGGTWYDPSNIALSNNTVIAGTIPGQFNYDYITGNGVCPDDTSNVLVTVTSSDCLNSLTEIDNLQFTVYPNPTDGILFITNEGSTENFNYDVRDINGRLILSEQEVIKGSTTSQINLSGNVAGIYIVNIYNQNSNAVYRIVLQ